MSLLNYALDEILDALTAAGLPVVFDPASAKPGVVIVDPPTITVRNASVAECVFSITCLTPPPANAAAERRMLDMADTVIQAVNAISGVPTIYATGGQNLPGYKLTTTITVKR